jgi:hypothetical protein
MVIHVFGVIIYIFHGRLCALPGCRVFSDSVNKLNTHKALGVVHIYHDASAGNYIYSENPEKPGNPASDIDNDFEIIFYYKYNKKVKMDTKRSILI